MICPWPSTCSKTSSAQINRCERIHRRIAINRHSTCLCSGGRCGLHQERYRLLGIECQGKVAHDTLKIPPPTLAVTELIVTAGAIDQAKETYDEFEQVGIRVIDRKEAKNTFVGG
jgi:hypothetical protein